MKTNNELKKQLNARGAASPFGCFFVWTDLFWRGSIILFEVGELFRNSMVESHASAEIELEGKGELG